MKRKNVEKLINKIDVDNNFEKINSQINYDKYVSNFENKKRIKNPIVTIAIATASLYGAIMLVLLADHASASLYNKNILKKNNELYSITNTSIYQVKSKNDYQELVAKDYDFKTSLLDKFVNGFDYVKNSPTWDEGFIEEDATPPTNGEAGDVGVENETQTNTNIQTEGIDEADVSKCDGTYIYSICNSHLGNYFEIYDLSGNTIISKELTMYHYKEMYVYEQSIALIGYNNTLFYSFDGKEVVLQNELKYDSYNNSRLVDDTLYLFTTEKVNFEQDSYENMYYNGCGNVNYSTTIIKYELDKHTYDEVRNLNDYFTNLYVSNNYFYLASQVTYYGHNTTNADTNYTNVCSNTITIVSVFDYNLNAIGAIRVKGRVLNQFSMDEYNNYFRVVTSNREETRDGRLNAISIYDLNTLNRVGYLAEGIGEGNQLVQSVTYDKDTCYVVTYRNTDPLYEIDLSDVTSPKIVSIYKAPGYSSYLHNFELNGQKYLFGIGYDDDRWIRKISIYIDNGNETVQIGKDYKITDLSGYYNQDNNLLVEEGVNHKAFNNHKALFIYNDNTNLYIGLNVSPSKYIIFKVDVKAESVVSIYKQIELDDKFTDSRCYLINGNIYITEYKKLYIESFR